MWKPWLYVGALLLSGYGCGRDEALPPDPSLFDDSPQEASARESDNSAADVADNPETSTQPPEPEPEPASPPADSLLDGPCPLPRETTSACLREPDKAAESIRVAHILIAWRGSTVGAPEHRDENTALSMALKLGHLARERGQSFFALMRRYSDDKSDGIYVLDDTAEARFAPGFVIGGRRLAVGSVDVIKTRFGYHVLKRVPLGAQAPRTELPDLVVGGCPALGEDPAHCGIARPVKAGWTAPERVTVEQVWISYQGARGRRRVTRTREDALALAVRIVHTARVTGADFRTLQRRYSDDPGNGRYEVTPEAKLLEPFVRMSLRLPPGGVDLVETDYGFHVLRRIR